MFENFISSATKQFQYYKMLGEKTIEQVETEKLFWQTNEASNSIAIIVNHLWGNMISRWTNFLHTDGEKPWRDRDLEFESVIKTKEELLKKWGAGWACLFDALKSVNETNFETIVYIRNQGHTIVEVVNRQLCHYAYHVGQIVFIGKMIKGDDWTSLSIPKGASKTYNAEKFAQPKERGHFSDAYLEEKS